MAQVNPSAEVNNVEKTQLNKHSVFPDFKYHFANTPRFGEASPCFVAEAVPDDEIPLNSACNLRSYTLKAPLMADVFHRKLYGAVPNEAILPLNWEKLYKNPKRGDDVDATLVGTSVPGFIDLMKAAFDSYYDVVVSPASTDEDILTYSFKYLVALEYIYSTGSLLNILGCKLWKYAAKVAPLGTGPDKYFDTLFDEYITDLITDNPGLDYFEVTIQGQTVKVAIHEDQWSQNFDTFISLRSFLDKIRDTFDWVVDSTGNMTSVSKVSKVVLASDPSPSDSKKPVDIERCLAYQILYSAFMTNPNVDNIYNAELYRQNVRSVLTAFNDSDIQDINSFPYSHFSYNGLRCEYDTLSSYNFVEFAANVIGVSASSFDLWFEYLNLIFGLRRTLRYGDYFTGAKTRPLAVGGTTVAVVNNTVDVIDVTKNIQGQRFLNQVNRLPGKMYDYVKGLFNVSQQQDFHEPIWLALTEDKVFDSEVENTGADQLSLGNSVTSTLRQGSSQFAFYMDYIDRPMVIMGIEYFDIPRYYDRSIERPFFHVGRFDMFNPMMQYTGDQRVYADELDATKSHAQNYGYQQKYMEYKQRYNQVSGAFAVEGVLPGWIPVADSGRNVNLITNIGPDYIRSTPSDFDKYYASLSGYSRGTYFHFIVDHNNICEPKRPMAFNPQIL